MIYITQKASPRYPQMSFDEFFSDSAYTPRGVILNEGNTRTVVVESLNDHYRFMAGVRSKTNRLREFNSRFEDLRSVPRMDLYETFYIPKKSGGVRQINAPKDRLKAALYELKAIFDEDFGARYLYHTSAFAYVKGRSTLDAVKRHQTNDSRWFLKLDLHDFFGSTTMDFVMHQLSMIYPFSEVIRFEEGEVELRKALDLAFLNGGLPQGTPISPLITNIMMIPVDHMLFNRLNNFDGKSFVYTRYADDFIISSRFDFRFRTVEELVGEVLAGFGAPFMLNTKKTRYGNRNGSNWNLGVMLNKDNVITIGKEKKRNFKAMLTNYAQDSLHGKTWPLEDIQVMEGLRSYYRMVEGEAIDKLVQDVGNKFGLDIKGKIKEDLSA